MNRHRRIHKDRVTLSAAEYASLLRDRGELAELRTARAPSITQAVGKSAFRFDQEVVGFLRDNAGANTIVELHRLAVEQFGKERAPNRTAIGEFCRKFRPVHINRRRRRELAEDAGRSPRAG